MIGDKCLSGRLCAYGKANVTPVQGRTATSPSDEERETGSSAAARLLAVGRAVPRPPGVRPPRRPRLWFEILLIAASYWLYSLVRNAVPTRRVQAFRNADWVWRTEHGLGIAVERVVNHAADSVTWLIIGMNYYYATLHFVVTVLVLVWLYRRQPGRYAPARLALFLTTGAALLGYYFFPLAPPRLMPGGRFVDTVVVHHTWGSMASGNLASMSNQYAAMPSIHIGWSLWCGLCLALLARPVWVRVAGLLYPLLTLTVIVSTANHFWLDAVGGALCLGLGTAVAYLWYGALPHRLPRHPSRAVPVAARAGARRGTSGTACAGAAGPAGATVAALRPPQPAARGAGRPAGRGNGRR
ncbi:phosphatase PAP2 family protein [Streptomyces sp. NPDC059740]|uniref:phosphatase PAP2 family protein n=1 Tax=Streptomyces sp. NPDC059740 TaxID=3346926 RepID=UPI003668CCBD